DRAVASGAGGRAGPAVCAAQHGRRLPPRLGERELPQVREAELRVCCAGSSRAWAAVLVDAVGGAAEDGRPAAGGGGGGEGAPRGDPAWRVRGDQRADRGGEREDLRGQASDRRWCTPGAGR